MPVFNKRFDNKEQRSKSTIALTRKRNELSSKKWIESNKNI